MSDRAETWMELGREDPALCAAMLAGPLLRYYAQAGPLLDADEAHHVEIALHQLRADIGELLDNDEDERYALAVYAVQLLAEGFDLNLSAGDG